MGVLIEAEGNGVADTEKSRAEKIRTSSPVVYQLVRVGVDGRLVPATDDELMEVEHLLEDDRKQLQSVELQRRTEHCPSEWLLQKTSNLEGLSSMEVDAQNINARLENFGRMEVDIRDRETSYSEEQDVDHEKINPMGSTSSDNNGDTARADKARTLKVGVKRKHHRAWTLSEVLRLVEGVARYGAGRWSEIRRVAFASYSYRTSVDLKDKWRNLIRASFAQDPSDKGARNFRKPTSVPLPRSILSRVRELAEMHSQSGIEFGPTKFAGHSGSVVQERVSGFL